MSNVVYDKTMKNLRIKIVVRLASKKGHQNGHENLNWTSYSNNMSQKIFDNDLVAILTVKLHERLRN